MRWSVFLAAITLAVMPPALDAQPVPGGLIGKRVVDASGNAVASVKDLVLDARSGRIRWVTLEHGGALGIGEEEAAVSPGELALKHGALQLALAPRSLERLPAFDRLAWPAMRASELLHREVRDRRHRDSGEIVGLVADLREARVDAVVIDLRDDWQPGERLVTVAFEHLSLPRDLGRYVVLDIDRERLGTPAARSRLDGFEMYSLPVRLAALLDRPLAGFAGEPRGRVADAVLDLANDRVAYAVLETAGRELAFPFAALELSLDNDRWLIAQPRERLARAPGLDECAGAPYWSAYWAGGAVPRLARASELIGRRFGEGELADVVIDAHEGDVAFALARLADGALHPVPLGAFSLQAGRLAFALPPERLDRKHDVRPDSLRDRAWVAAAARYAAALGR